MTENNKETNTELKSNDSDITSIVDDKAIDFKVLPIWIFVLLIYIFLLSAIGYIAFWDQDFNKPKHKIEPYITMLSDYKKQSAATESELTNSEISAIIQEIMKKDADSAGDLQELASQSFNIVLGAILAFLSASSTMVFQKLSDARNHKKKV